MSRVLVASHDAGAAEIISAWVKRHPENEYRFLIDGPAQKIFGRKMALPHVLSFDEAVAALGSCDWVLSGTSWSSDLERLAVREAKRRGVRVVAQLDHWSAYPERFLYRGQTVMPDELWVGDSHALTIAKESFPGFPAIRLEPNLYFEEMIESVAAHAEPRAPGGGLRILYVTEPIAKAQQAGTDDPLRLGYEEFQALEGFLEYLRPRRGEVDKVRIRAHPAESREKYQPVVEKYGAMFPMELNAGTTLAQDCAWCDWVVGCDSAAMVVGVITGRRVLCSIPAQGEPPVLPFPEIERLFLR